MTQTIAKTNDRETVRREKGLDAGIHSVAGIQPPLFAGREPQVALWRREAVAMQAASAALEALKEDRRDENLLRAYVLRMRRCCRLNEVSGQFFRREPVCYEMADMRAILLGGAA